MIYLTHIIMMYHTHVLTFSNYLIKMFLKYLLFDVGYSGRAVSWSSIRGQGNLFLDVGLLGIDVLLCI